VHLLNIHHPDILYNLCIYRENRGRPWQEWEFVPQYSIEPISDEKIRVNVDPEWGLYGLTKAIWQIEPGYMEKMMGGPGHEMDPYRIMEEKEALLARIPLDDRLSAILQDRFIDEFIWYEIIGKKEPAILYVLPLKIFDRIVEYVDRYH